MPNYIYIATSLDGFIARKDGSIDWLLEIPNPEKSDFGFSDFIRTIDAIVMGRKTYETVLAFNEWPYNKPVFVLSNTLQSLPQNLSDKVEIIKGSPELVVNALNERQFKNLYIDGGKTIQSFLNENLIDEMIITKVPIILGEGIPLFGKLVKEQKFAHIKTEVLFNCLVKSHYKKNN
jgi:dihydrofolate reductase